MLWEKLTSDEFDGAIERAKGLCVVPIGCLERHGQHIAVGCDSFLAKNISEAAAEKEECVVFPTGFWMGDIVTYHSLDLKETRRRGSFSINPNTLLALLQEICDEIGRNGFRKILLVSAHGGNTGFLNYFVRAQMYDKHDYATLWTKATDDASIQPAFLLERYKSDPSKYPDITAEDIATLERFAPTGTGGGHADFTESMLCMSIDEGLVRPDKFDAESGDSVHIMDFLGENGVFAGAAWGANYPNAFNGYQPIGCSAAIGDIGFDMSVERLAKIFRIIKDDEKAVQLAKRVPFE